MRSLRAGQLRRLFVANFVEAYAAGQDMRQAQHRQWIGELPDFLFSQTDQALQFAIRAVTTAFYGRLVGNDAIELEGCRWYGGALTAQRQSTCAGPP